MTYPRNDYWEQQTPEFREAVLATALRESNRSLALWLDRAMKAEDALDDVAGMVGVWEWIPERGDVLSRIKEVRP